MWLSVQTVIALMCSLVVIQGVAAQTAEQTLDLSSVSGNVVIDTGGTWLLTGSLAGGVTVDVGSEDIVLILDGVEIANDAGPAIAFISSGNVTLETTVDSENVLSDGGASEMDAVIWAEADLTFTGEGTLDITAVNEGIESTTNIVVDGGTILIHAGEDGINANTDGVSQITINDGTVLVETTAGDGIDSNGGIEINGGNVVSYGAMVDGNSGLDADGLVVINGGTVIASGGQMSTIDASSQQSFIWASFDGNLAAGTGVVLMNGDEVVVALQVPVDVQSLVISTPDLDVTAANELLIGGTFEVDSASLSTGTITDAGTHGGTLSETNPGGMRGRP